MKSLLKFKVYSWAMPLRKSNLAEGKLSTFNFFIDFMFTDEALGDGVEHAVDVAAAARCAVHLGNLYVLVDADANRNGGEGRDFGKRNLHDDEVHLVDALDIPVLRLCSDELAEVFHVLQCGAEERDGKLLVFLVLEGRHDGLQGPHLLVEPADSLQHKGVNDGFVIVPVEAVVFEDVVQLFVVADECTVDFAPEFAVFLVGRRVAMDIELEEVLLGYFLVHLPQEVLFVFCPVYGLLLLEGTQLFVFPQLGNELVLDELGGDVVGLVQTFGSTLLHLDYARGNVRDANH